MTKMMVKKLKKQLTKARRNEKVARNQLRTALKKVNMVTKAYERKIAKKAKELQTKMNAVQIKTYEKLAQNINQMKRKAKTTAGRRTVRS